MNVATFFHPRTGSPSSSNTTSHLWSDPRLVENCQEIGPFPSTHFRVWLLWSHAVATIPLVKMESFLLKCLSPSHWNVKAHSKPATPTAWFLDPSPNLPQPFVKPSKHRCCCTAPVQLWQLYQPSYSRLCFQVSKVLSGWYFQRVTITLGGKWHCLYTLLGKLLLADKFWEETCSWWCHTNVTKL